MLEDNFSSLLCGSDLSTNEFSRDIVEKVILSNFLLVLDADALYFLDDVLLNMIKNRKNPTVLAPHEGEMARLCRLEYEEIKNNRFSISKLKATKWGVYLVLKG